jgi:hypothetical protein
MGERLQHSNIREFSIPLSTRNRSYKKKKNVFTKGILDLNHTLGQKNLMDICRIFHPTASVYFFSLRTYRTLSRMDHMLVQNQLLTNLRRLKPYQVFLPANSMKLQINNRNFGKFETMWILNDILVNNQLVKEEIKGELKKSLETNKSENTVCHNV